MIENFENYKNIGTLLAIFFAVTTLSYLIITFIKYIIVKKTSNKITASATKLDDLFLDIFKNIKKYFILTLSVYIGLKQLELTNNWNNIINKRL